MRLDQSCWAVVPAAGVGSRLGAATPKQYLSIAGRPLISYALDSLLSHHAISGVVVVVSEDDRQWETLSYNDHPRVRVAAGGATRAHSVFHGLQALQSQVDDEHWVLVHDAARPALTHTVMDRLFAAVSGHDVGGLLGLPVVDTVKRVSMQGEVKGTVPREQVWLAQTPQIFRYGLLYKAISQSLDAGEFMTDESSAMESLGLQPKMVLGEERNFKVTTWSDLEKMQQLIAQETS